MSPGNRRFGCWLAVLGGLVLAGCGSTPPESTGGTSLGGHYKLGNPYQIGGRWYYPTYDPSYAAVGVASWYGYPFHGRKTANGELYDMQEMTAAHPTLPLPSVVRVTNLANQREVELRVNDRGPFVGDRIIDLSQAAARALGFERRGTTEVRVEFVRLAEAQGAPPVASPGPTARVAARQEAPIAMVQPAVAPIPPVPVAAVRVASVPADGRPAGSTASLSTDKRCVGTGFIQVGAFAEPERAVRLAKELGATMVWPVSAELPATDRYARVRLGPLGDRRQAEAALQHLRAIGYANAYLIKPDVTSSVAC